MLRSIAASRSTNAALLVAGAAALILAVTSDRSYARGAAPAPCYAAASYPGDTASRVQLARWMGAAARAAGLPPELPVMAALTESGLRNRTTRRSYADSVGFFQMRTTIWNSGEYKGYASKPELQLKWFIDSAIAVKMQRYAQGAADPGGDPSSWGEWIADVERPAQRFPGRYQLQLGTARSLLAGSGR